ncbi:polyphenol oxidase family protein, partial [Actinomadura sp. CNU-125]|uniref:polyphenol oxidase family protein n=1 Tax=Actinomadura sp. CNU-125 TaxID=1904961 RepID=UPI000AEED08E
PSCWPTPSRASSRAHSGRPGTAAGVVPALLARMREHGATRPDDRRDRPRRVRRLLRGPGRDARRRRRRRARRARHHVPRHPRPRHRAGVAAQLAAGGVTDVRTDPRCTIEDPDLFSYRRDGRTGRFAGYVWLTEREERP